MKNHFGKIWQFIKFCIVGVSNTLISLLVYYVVIWLNVDMYLLGNVLGWIISVLNAFYWSRKYVFDSKTTELKDILKELIKMYISYGSTFVLSTVMLYIEVELFKMSAIICPIMNVIITIPINFILNKFWTFK